MFSSCAAHASPCLLLSAPTGAVAFWTLSATIVQPAPGQVCSGGASVRWSVRPHAFAEKLEPESPPTHDLNLQVDRVDGRRLEVVANGLPLWGGQQLAVDTTLVSPLSGQGQPVRRGGRVAGAALAVARRRKERAYPELVRAHRCRLVVLAVEVGGRWSDEAASFIRSLARAGHLKRPLGCAPVLSALLLPSARPS